MKQTMKNITIESNQQRRILKPPQPLTEVEAWFIESMSEFLTNFKCRKRFFGFYKTYGWEGETPKISVRMFLFNFDGKNGTDYLKRIFGDDPCPEFIISNRELSEKLCHAIICEPCFNSRDIDEEIELHDRMLEKFDL
jgi:hypothetical protein